jgi:hypothetical protein
MTATRWCRLLPVVALLAAWLPVASSAPPAPDPAREAVRKALDATAARNFAYALDGRFKRTGEFCPPDILSARVDPYRSARRGDVVLVKGPEGIWRTPAEHLGEVVLGKKPPKDLADKIRLLETAEPPQDHLRELFDLTDRGSAEADAAASGTPCRVYLLQFAREPLRDLLEKQIAREVRRGDTPPPERILWETLRGSLRVFVDRREGVLVRVVEDRSVRLVLPGKDDERRYRNWLTADFTAYDRAPIDLPPEVKERLGIAGGTGGG